MKKIIRCLVVAAMTLSTVFFSASAQNAVIVQTPPGFEVSLGDIVLPPGVQLPPGVKLPSASPQTTNASAKAESPEDKRLQELLKLKFDRSAASILTALSAQFDGKSTTNEVEQFKQRVIVGDWKAVGEFLAALPKDHGKQVYRYLIKELSNTTRPDQNQPPMPEGFVMGDQPVIFNNPNQQGPANSAGPTLVVEDVLALAAIAPHEFTDGDAKSLGQLLGKLLARGDALEPILPKLEQGVKNLGGSKPEERRHAAELLLGANRLTEAAKFLAPIELAKEKLEWRALEQHARDLAARGTKERDGKLLMQAWDLNQFIIGLTNVAATNRDPALRRCMDLLPQLSREIGTNWLRQSFQGDPAQGLAILSTVNQLVQKGLADRNLESRRKNLESQKQVVEIFLAATDPRPTHWRAALSLLAQGWMQEAAWAKQRWRPQRSYGPQYDQYGNMISYEPYPQEYYDGNQIPALPVDQVLATAPGEAWLKQLDAGLRLGVFALIADLHTKTDAPDKALPLIEALASAQPRVASDLANSFLRAWATARNPNRNQQQMGGSRYMVGGVMYYGNSPYGQQGISLTRAMQARNIKELADVVRQLGALRLPNLSDDALLGAFTAAHSQAEVFRVEDIEAVFGPRDLASLDLLAGLSQTMRERLATQWRQPRVQQEAKTQRNDKQIEAEVLRGYDVVLKLISDGLDRDGDNWRLHLARSAAIFDLAEFQYGKKVDLAIYVEKREEAFKGFERAASLYATALPGLGEKGETPLAYQQWFNANLGASDLAYVTRQQEPETNQLARIRSAILALPGGATERHLAAFAKQLGQSANSLRPELKPRYLRAGLQIVGDHPDAADARKLVTYYNDLLRELEFVVRLDGDATVGHGKPFGVFVALRHTADIEREAGGFGRYLRNTKSGNVYYSNPAMGQQRNFTEEFEKQVREKLADHFDVKTVTFLDDKVKSRGYGRPGWRETPLAYLLLQAKDGSVDQLPAFRMDLDFLDSRGQVVLPVESEITLIDARPDRVAARPVEQLEVTQILDDREIAKGNIALEIKASAHGLVPDFGALLRTNFAGLHVTEFNDPGLSVAQIDAEADTLAPVSERNWMIKFAVADDAPARLDFKFAEPAGADAKMVYKRYVDADLVEVKPTLALAGVSLRPRPWWHWLVLAGVVGTLGAVGAWWMRRQRVEHQVQVVSYTLPEQITPFAVINLLRRMETDGALRLDEKNKAELTQTIRQLETHFFDRQRNGHAEPDIVDIGKRWVARAGNGG